MTQPDLEFALQHWAQHSPGKIAVKSEKLGLTYKELDQRSSHIAAQLRKVPGTPPHIAILLPRSPELIIAIYGILKYGGVFIPIDPTFPSARIQTLLAQTNTQTVITDTHHYEKFKTTLETLDSPPEILFIDNPPTSNTETSPKERNSSPPEHCYIYFTSGSSGTPKAVLGLRKGLAHFIRWEIDTFSADASINVSQLTPPSFDPFLRDIFLPITAGGTCHIPNPETLLTPQRLIQWLEKENIHLVHTVPSLFRRLMPYIPGKDSFSRLKYILLAGELLHGRDIRRFCDLFHPRIQLVNIYGPTETTLAKCFHLIQPRDCDRAIVPVGQPIHGAQVLVLDRDMQKCRPGKKGEVHIRTPFRSAGYYNDPELTQELFIPNPFGKHPQDLLYKTGDTGRLLPGGLLEISGRIDFQVKIRGVRIETAEIENRLLAHDHVREAAVVAAQDPDGEKCLCAYLVPHPLHRPAVTALRRHLAQDLPAAMVPAYFVFLEQMPLNPNGKLDRARLPNPAERAETFTHDMVPPRTHWEKQVAQTWQEVLKLPETGVTDNFFELGGNSLAAMEISRRLSLKAGKEILVTRLFEHPTAADLATYIESLLGETPSTPLPTPAPTPQPTPRSQGNGREIAITGMSCRFPGARDIAQFRENLRDGRESITFFSREELLEAGVSPDQPDDPNYVRAASLIAGKEYFDARFFGYSPQEAELLDPQVRLLHQCTWEALEDAGIAPAAFNGSIGLYAGGGQNFGWEARALVSGKSAAFGLFAASRLTGIRYLCTRVAYNLNLKGPGIYVQTACSTALTAVHTARRALLEEECDVAVAGGVGLSYEKPSGYLYQPGSLLSSDGHCRPFDAEASGTIFGEGAGVVVLKRLDRALAEGDNIHAVIRGSAANNDGSRKVGFSAPSVAGQAQAVRAALRDAGVEARSIGYVEAHAPGTGIGDMVEFEALVQAFNTTDKQFCYLGSVKSNVGHLDAAAGAAGLIKAVLALKHRRIPPSINFNKPLPGMDLPNSPFRICTALTAWEPGPTPRRAGVSSLGMGGTNLHVILEEAPPIEPSPPGREYQLLVLSAKTPTALERMGQNLARFLEAHPDTPLADAAYTLQTGREAFRHRRVSVCKEPAEAVTLLSQPPSPKAPSFHVKEKDPPVIFMFSGRGGQYRGMGAGLYRGEPFFRETVDQCLRILETVSGGPIVQKVSHILGLPPGEKEPQDMDPDMDMADLHGPQTAQPSVFIFEYALARLIMSWGIRPRAMIGYSFGEVAAACISGVLSLEDALRFIALRGRLLEQCPAGAMASVPLSPEEAAPLLPPSLSIAVDNGPSCLVAGAPHAVAAFTASMKNKRILCTPIQVVRALHSQMMEPILAPLEAGAASISFRGPQIPYISDVSGDWTEPGEVTRPGYWARHLRETVRFAEGIQRIIREIPNAIFTEIGPGRDMYALVGRHIENSPGFKAIHLARAAGQERDDHHFLLNRLARLWLWGVSIDWNAFHRNEKRRKISLPTYPFEERRYWIDVDPFAGAAGFPANPANAQGYQNNGVTEPGQEAPQPPEMGNGETGPAALAPRPEVETEYAAPRDSTEELLARLWGDFFGFERIGIDDDFFDMGGDSLKATVLITRIQAEVSAELQVNDILKHSTIRKLAPVLDNKMTDDKGKARDFLAGMFGTPDDSSTGEAAPAGGPPNQLKEYVETPLAVLNPEAPGDKTIFCFPPSMAHGLAYKSLSRLLPDYRFYSFNFFEEMDRIQRYLELIREHQPEGPYIFFEYSAGAKLAFEVAHRLEEKSWPVSKIIMVDSLWPRETVEPEVPGVVVRGIESYLDDIGSRDLTPAILARVQAYRRYFMDHPAPEPVGADIHLILSEENHESSKAQCWKPFTSGGNHIYPGSGTHDEMLMPGHLEKNCAIIREILG